MTSRVVRPGAGPRRVFVKCSAKHKQCSPFHAAIVRGYQAERERQETELEAVTGGYRGDREHWAAQGGRLINFKQWLISNKQPEHARVA